MKKRGGQGALASTEQSKQHDSVVKLTSMALAKVLILKGVNSFYFEEGYRRSGSKENWLPEFSRFHQGCMPDGGMWFSGPRSFKRILVLATEAKYQGTRGNAIERWGKNKDFCLSVNPEMTYLTFYSGPGAAVNEVLWKHSKDMESSRDGKNLVNHLKVEPFTYQEVFQVLKNLLKVDVKFDDIKPYLSCRKSVDFFRTKNQSTK